MNQTVKTVNGEVIPVNLSLDKLSIMMESSEMKRFTVACEALLLNGTYEAYEILKKYISIEDTYRRRYVLSVIYQFPFAKELTGELEKAILSKNKFIVNTALDVLLKFHIKVSDLCVISALQNGKSYIYSDRFSVISSLSKTEENYQAVLALYQMNSHQNSNRAIIAESLSHFCTPSRFTELFNLFRSDSSSKVRMAACRLAEEFGFGNLLEQFADDPDGHIRKFIARN